MTVHFIRSLVELDNYTVSVEDGDSGYVRINGGSTYDIYKDTLDEQYIIQLEKPVTAMAISSAVGKLPDFAQAMPLLTADCDDCLLLYFQVVVPAPRPSCN